MTAVKVPTKVQKRSGFDWSHHNALTQLVGKIVPVFFNEIIPNTKINLRFAMAGSMPPLSTDAYMKVYYDVRAFFVPMRLLYGGFESWYSDYPFNRVSVDSGSGQNAIFQSKCNLPYFSLDPSMDFNQIFGHSTLADYLGMKIDNTAIASFDTNVEFSMMPFLAYHKVCNDWYRQPNISAPFYARPSGGVTGSSMNDRYAPSMSPFISPAPGGEVCTSTNADDFEAYQFLFADDVSIFSLRSANYDYDYFTNALPSAQLGNPVTISTSGGNFSISSLRAGNSLQQFAELNQLCGSDQPSVNKARYGANLSSGIAQKAIYLGGTRIDIANRSVDVKNSTSAGYSMNPFINQPGASGGKVVCQGTDVIIDNFVTNEPGYIFVMGIIVPKVTYASGVRRLFRKYIGNGSIVELPNPLLQNVGNQPIYQYELNGAIGVSAQQNLVFGYTDRFGEAMTMEDEVHGLMAFGENLQSFIAQRYFVALSNPTINSNFLAIPTTALDNITAVTSQISQFGMYAQFAFDCKLSQPLAQYSLPSLQNPAYEHGKTVMVHRGGFRF